MAKATKKAARKSRAKKSLLAKKTTPSKSSKSESVIPPRKRAKILKQLAKIGPQPSRPTDVGPHLDLSFDAPVHPQQEKQKRKPAKKRKA